MARVTVEDCLENVDNRFELVLVASKRARQLAKGREALVEEENDKPTVIALREIAENLVNAAILDEKPEEIVDEELEAETGEVEVELEGGSGADAEGIDVAAAIKAALGGIGGAMEDDNAEVSGDSGEAAADDSDVEGNV